MLNTRERQIAVAVGAVVLLVVVGLIGAYFGGQASRDRAAQAEATPQGPPVESLVDCPWGEGSCILALGIEHALQAGRVDAVMEFTEPRTYFCPGRPPEGGGGPFPLCDDVGEFESREGYPLLTGEGDSSVVDKTTLGAVVSRFLDGVNADARDDIGPGKVTLYAFGCPQRAVPFQNIGCARLAIILTAIVVEGREQHRELLVFWAAGNYRGRTLPVIEVWEGMALTPELDAIFRNGGFHPGLGEVYVIDQDLRGDAGQNRR